MLCVYKYVCVHVCVQGGVNDSISMHVLVTCMQHPLTTHLQREAQQREGEPA